MGKRYARARGKIGGTEQARKPWRGIHIVHAGWVADRCSETPRTLPVKRIDHALPEVVEVESISRPDGSLPRIPEQRVQKPARRMRRIGDGETGRKIFIIPRPIRLLSIRLSRKIEA